VGLSGRRLATQAADNAGHCFEFFSSQPTRLNGIVAALTGRRNSPLETVPQLLVD
jgi:hypothetical protein